MYSISWLTYYFNMVLAYGNYWVSYFINMFQDYPLEVRTAAFNITASLIGILVIRLTLLKLTQNKKREQKIRKQLRERFGAGLDYIISEEASPTMTRREVMHAMGIEKEIAEKKPLLKNKQEKWYFCRLAYRACTSCRVQEGRWNNLQMMLTLFQVQEYLESEVSSGSRRHKVKCLSMLRSFKLYISPWVINKLLDSSNTRVHRLAMYSLVGSSADNDLDYYETDFFDENCCIYDEIELGYALQRRRRSGFKLPNLATWALRQQHPETKCVFVRLMRRFEQTEFCDQLVDLYKESKHKKLIEEISRTWGYLHYVDGEQLLTDALLMQPDDTKVAILHALTRLDTGKSLKTLEESFYNHTNPHVRFEALRCLYNYGDKGKARFTEMEQKASENDQKYFAFFHNPITLSKIRLDKEQAYHPSVETVYNWS